MVNIKSNAWHAKIWRYVYRIQRMPNSLCPYFWTMLLALLVAPVLFITQLPYLVLCLTIREMSDFRDENHGERALWSLMIFCILALVFILFSPGLYLLGLLDYENYDTPIIFGTIIWIAAAVVGIVWLFVYLYNRELDALDKQYNYGAGMSYSDYKRKKREILDRRWKLIRRIPSPSKWLVVRTIKAFYEKNCPIIKWN